MAKVFRYAIIHSEESLDWLEENTTGKYGRYYLKDFGNLKLYFQTNKLKVIVDMKKPKEEREFTVWIEGNDPETLSREDFIKKYCYPYVLFFNETRTFVWGTKEMLELFFENFSLRFPELEFELADDLYVIDSDRNRAEKRYFEIMEKKSKDK
jgi:hypothetical protein